MKNELAQTFSDIDEKVALIGGLKFQDSESRELFQKKLLQSIKDGNQFEADVIDSIAMNVTEGDFIFPLFESIEPKNRATFISGNEIKFKVENGEEVNLFIYNHNDKVEIESYFNKIIYFSLVSFKNSEKIKVDYNIDIENCKTVDQGVKTIETFLYFLKYIFCLSKSTLERVHFLKKIFEFFMDFYYFFYILNEVEETTEKRFIIGNTVDLDRNLKKATLLHSFLIGKKPIRSDQRLSNIDTKKLNIITNEEPRKNQEIKLYFESPYQISLLNHDFPMETQNVIFTVITNINKSKNLTRYSFGYYDFKPTYLVYQGFLDKDSLKTIEETYQDFQNADSWEVYYQQLKDSLAKKFLND